MARINLLPWREERQKQRQRQFMTLLGATAFAALVAWFGIDTYYGNQISGQQERNAYLDQRIAEVDKEILQIKDLRDRRDKLLARKKVIEELQANRSQMVHLFDSLVRTIPDGVILTTITQEGTKLTLEGRAQSSARVSSYMRAFETSGWMTRPDLSIIQAEGDDKGLPYMFKLSVMLANPNDPNNKDAAKAGAPVDPNAAVANAAQLPALSPAQPGAAPAAGGAAPARAPAAPAATAPGQAPAAPAPAQPTGGAKS